MGVFVLVAGAACAIGVASFWKHFSYDASPSKRAWCQVVLVGGNFRFIVAVASATSGDASDLHSPPDASLSDNAPTSSDRNSPPTADAMTDADLAAALAHAKLFWERHLLVTIPWSWRTYDRDASGAATASVRETRVDVSSFILAAGFAFAALLLGPIRRIIVHVPGVLREIRHPTGGSFCGPWPRAPRRVVVGLLGVIAIAATLLTISPFDRPIAWTMNLGTKIRCDVFGRTLEVAWEIDASNPAPPTEFGFPGFKVGRKALRRFPGFPSGRLPTGFPAGMSPADFSKALSTVTTARSTTVEVSLLYPLLLCAVYPLFALIRGPVRRHCHRLRGHCLKCGYNLTGNVSGVCPECGAMIECDAIPRGTEDGQDKIG